MQVSKNQIHLATGELLFKQGDKGDCAYIVESGQVLIFLEVDQSEVVISNIKKGEIFGEMSLIDNLPRSASVKATENTILNVVTKDQLFDRFKDSDPLVQLLLKVMINRVRKNNSIVNSKIKILFFSKMSCIYMIHRM